MTGTPETGTVAGMAHLKVATDARFGSNQAAATTSIGEVASLVLLAVVAGAMALFAITAVTASRGGTTNDARTAARPAPPPPLSQAESATVVLVVGGSESMNWDERIQNAEGLGMLGDFEVVLVRVPIDSPDSDGWLRTLLPICEEVLPPGDCDPVLILDLR